MSWLRRHPDPVTLERYANGESPDGEGERVQSHLLACSSCRDHVEFVRSLAREASQLSAPEPPTDLIRRVVAERSSSHGTIVALAGPARRELRPRRVAVLAAVLALVILAGILDRLVINGWSPHPANSSGPAEGADCMANSPLRQLLNASGLLLATACAQQATEPVPSEPVTAAVLDPSRLSPVRLRYEDRSTTDGIVTVVRSEEELTVQETTFKEMPAWRLVAVREHRFGAGRNFDTTYIDRETLRPLTTDWHYVTCCTNKRSHTRKAYSADSVTVHSSFKDWRRDFTVALPDSTMPIASGTHVNQLLVALPLSQGWEGSLLRLGWDPRGEPWYRTSLRVVGDDKVSVPAGTFDCWRLESPYDSGTIWWVSKDQQWLIKTWYRSDPDYEHETVLISAEELD